jgi:hypothetical protein
VNARSGIADQVNLLRHGHSIHLGSLIALQQ